MLLLPSAAPTSFVGVGCCTAAVVCALCQATHPVEVQGLLQTSILFCLVLKFANHDLVLKYVVWQAAAQFSLVGLGLPWKPISCFRVSGSANQNLALGASRVCQPTNIPF